MVEARFEGESGPLASRGGTEVSMNNAKTLITWLLLCLVCAGGTILAVQMIDKPLGLRQKVVNFGH